jgi:hypothetical protein
MLTFQSPKGWEIPQDAQPGKPFSAVGTFTIDDEGNITLVEIDGSPIEAPEMEMEMEVEEEGEMPESGMTDIDAAMKRAEEMGLFTK